MTTALTLTHRAAAGECYEDVFSMIQQTVQRFVRRYGGDYQELLGDANTAYLKGYVAYTEGRNNTDNFELEIKRWVWFELFDAYRVRAQHRRTVKVVIKQVECPEHIPHNRPRFDMLAFMDELSADAQIAANLVLDTPADIAHMARLRGGTDRNLRRLIREHLAACGWGAPRIAAAFEEVTKALA